MLDSDPCSDSLSSVPIVPMELVSPHQRDVPGTESVFLHQEIPSLPCQREQIGKLSVPRIGGEGQLSDERPFLLTQSHHGFVQVVFGVADSKSDQVVVSEIPIPGDVQQDPVFSFNCDQRFVDKSQI